MNKIYRIIWNSTLGAWVVTSELGRGKIKSATSKTLTALALTTLLATSATASQCNSASLLCDLDSAWSFATNNRGAGSVTISDGQTYRVNGPKSYRSAPGSYITFRTVNELINAGYINAALLPDDDTYVELGVKSQSVTVIDPITNASNVVSVYNSGNLQEFESGHSIGGYGVARTGPLSIYYQTRLVTVNSGTADIYADGLTISSAHRDSQLVYADSTVTNQAATANWHSKNTINLPSEPDYASASTQTATAKKTTYAGSFTAFNGGATTVTSLSELQRYNQWLIGKMQSGELAPSRYDSELAKAYTTASSYYQINRVPVGVDPILTQPVGVTTVFMANGDKATVRLAATGRISGDIRGAGSENAGVFRLTNGATGINDGEIDTSTYTATVLSGSHFINNGSLTTGLANGVPGYGVRILGLNSVFTNNGTLNIRPQFWSSTSSGNSTAWGVTVVHYASAINHGTMNIGITEGNKGRETVGSVYGVRIESKGNFTNSASGVINIGRAVDGSEVYVKPGSSAIRINTGISGKVENQGHIVLGTKVEGSAGIHALVAGTHDVTNSGTITLLSNGDNGAFTPRENIGIYAQNNARGINNTGLIDIQGINGIGIKTLSGGQVSSSGQINVTGGADPSTGLRNYGVWSQGLNSLIDISGSVNLKGNGAIGVHARDKGAISLSGQGKVNFSDGENQIGFYIYGTGSKINNTSTGTQDVTTNNSTLMRLDGGAAFTGASGATSTMSASGDNAQVIVATGSGTTVDSGGMTVKVNGKNATGFLIEGGATGTISNTANINLSGEGAIAGIADGQGYDLTGAKKSITEAEKKATSLTAGANLHSALDGVVGYIARNLATLTNSGNITFSGDNTTGIQVEEGAVGANSGNITLAGQGGVGLKASARTLETKLSSTGNLTLNGSWDGVNDATRTTGVLADGHQVSVTIGDGINTAAMNLKGAGSVGVQATGGSTVTLDDKVAVNFDSNNTDQVAFWVDGSGSQIITQAGDTETQVNGDGATMFYVTNGATMDGVLNLNLSGKAGSHKITSGIRVKGAGSEAKLASGSQLTIGTNATGVLAENAGKAVIAAGAAFHLSGKQAIVGKATGQGSRVENNATVTSVTDSRGSTAFLAENGGVIDNNGNINLSVGSEHTAIDLNNGHVVNRGNIQANGTAIHIQGRDSTIVNAGTIEAVDGKAAIHIDAGAGLNLSAVSGGTGTIKADRTADGILLSEGALSLNVANSLIDMSGINASGIGIHNVAGIQGITLDNTRIKLGGTGIGIKTGASLAKTNSGAIDVTDGIGILYLNENGSAVASDIDLSDSANLVMNVAGQGVGMKATLDGQQRSVNTAIGVNVTSATGGSAIDVSGAKSVENSGQLISDSTVANGNVLNVHNADTISNSGTILASSAEMTAIAMSHSGNKTLTNTGKIRGLLDFALGDNQINLTGGQLTGNIKAHGGANTLTASAGTVQRGEISLTGDKAQTVTVKGASTVGHVTLGDGNNVLTVDDSTTGHITTGDGHSELTFRGEAVAGNIALGTGNNHLILSDKAHIDNMTASAGGNNFVVIKDVATFDKLDAGKGGEDDQLTFDGAKYALDNTADIQHFDQLNLIRGARFITGHAIQMGETATSVGHIAIDGRSSLVLTPAGAYTLNHALSGSGLVEVTSGTRFDFGSDVGHQFTGRVHMNSTDFALSRFNTTALTQAMLSVMDKNTTIVGTGNQVIGGLSFNGGTVDFGVSIPSDTVSANRIQVETLNARGKGKVQVKHPLIDNGIPPVVPPAEGQTRGLLDQQTETLVQLVTAASVVGGAGNLVLIDENGEVISHATGTTIYQDGIQAAKGHYNYRLTTTDNEGQANGLYVGYGLTQLDLLSSGADKLVINTDHSTEKQLSAKVTGSGDLGIQAGNGADALTLSNLDNSYTGVTDLKSGTVKLGTDNGFGATSKLSLANTTTADINGKTQTIGALDGQAGSTLNLNGGDLTLTDGGMASGTLTGEGDLTVSGGTLTVTVANANLSATTTVKAGAQALLDDVLALGTGQVVADGKVTLNAVNGTFANELSGSGQLNSHNGSEVTLSGNNRDFAGVMDIDATSTLTVSETQHLGATTEVKNANQVIVNNSAAMTLAAIVSGTGELIKQNSGTLTLSGSNRYTGQTDIQGGTVAISSDANLGSTDNLTRLNGGDLQITADLTSTRDVTLVQDGRVIVDSGVTASMGGWDDQSSGLSTLSKAGDGTLIWTGDNSANTANVSVTGGTLQVASIDNLASANGEVHLGANGRLSILQSVDTAADVDFTRQLSGSGELWVSLADKAQALTLNASSAGGDFTGQLTLDNGHFTLNTEASQTLAQSTLQLNGGAGKLGSARLVGEKTLGGLTMNGGQLEVAFSNLNHRPEGVLTVKTLDVTGGGNLAILTPANLPNPIPVTGDSLFDQDDEVIDVVVNATDRVNGVGTQIELTDINGALVAPDTTIGLVNNGTTVGNAHYNYFGSVKEDGLYLGYGLTQIDAFADQSVILTNAYALDNSLGAKLTGDGGFTINANGTARIGNASSDYTGTTHLNSGNVELITNNGLGQTRLLNMQSGTGLDLNGNRQTLGSLAAMVDSVINLNGGELTITDGGQSDGTFTGQGDLILTGSTLSLNQNSSQFTGTTTIDSGATARLTQPQGLGQGTIHLQGTLNLDSAKGTLLNSLNGDGETLLTNAADMYLGGNNTDYSGTFMTQAGTTLTATEKNQLGTATIHNSGTFTIDTAGLWTLDSTVNGSGTVVKKGSGTLQLEANNVTAGLTRIENGLLLIGGEQSAATTANLNSHVTIEKEGALGGYGSVTGNVTNRGNLIMGHALTGGGHGEFTINGDYIGTDNSTIIFNTTLDDDASATDMLRITGNTAGTSHIMVRSARGEGAQTSDGIKLIDVAGTSNAQFTLSGRAVAGAYDYFLYQGAISTPDDGNWYLRSSLSSLNPDPSIYRPEAGGYMANMAAAGHLFSLRLADREGRAENSSLWLRQVGSRNKHRDSTGQLQTATNSYVVQGGGEVWSTQFTDADQFGLGVMMAYGKADGKTHSKKTGYKANSTLDGYSTGLYGTWYQDAKTLNGAYVDSWLQYSWLDAEVNGQSMAKESYKMDGFSASLEAGYRLSVYQGLNSEVFITPQGQISWNGIKADDHIEAGGTKVASSGHDNVQTRLGLKVSRDGVSDGDKGTDKLFTVYAEANWLHNSQQAGAVLDAVEVKQSGSRHVGELKLGAEGQVNQNLSLWSNVAQQLGDNGYSDTSVTLGVKVHF
ncbi:Outer membrane protein IcsA autotransporter precursor [Pragia fontium]|uniref:autotransporter outer membrane beta-barrel domain-containing protein n=1 Tax=Pragia fontium TaxID=82985 RepID=UPI000E075BF8|nr:autotransporter outer membrane beta-barrel domain-containing protein [Pragia fontium]SUB81480.1 Outer membrane protein IcsA autotransporter precursor [Pragia fontium]